MVADRTGAPWRDVPERYEPWDRVYDLFRHWQRDGTWARIVTRLQAQADARLHWSHWPRQAQHRARISHYKRRGHSP
ncbi:transposase [Streptomyces sp. NPDC087228]|uniref:transposase n=1 Tax=unclassified Streptomyces TaxID=2593676 RepID=UPI0038026AAD